MTDRSAAQKKKADPIDDRIALTGEPNVTAGNLLERLQTDVLQRFSVPQPTHGHWLGLAQKALDEGRLDIFLSAPLPDLCKLQGR